MIRKANCRAIGVFFGAIFICCLGLATISEAADPALLGTVQRIQGVGAIQHAGAPEPQALAEGDPVFLQDLIGTDQNPDSKVCWKGAQAVQADASLGTATVLQFLEFPREARGDSICRRGYARDLEV